MPPTPAGLRTVFDQVERYVRGAFGISVRMCDVPIPYAGDLNGSEIQIDRKLRMNDGLFVLVHLFGHTVQWNISAKSRAIGLTKQLTWSNDELAELGRYEEEACRYSLQLLHDVGVHHLTQWLSDYSACDFAYVQHFYKTGKKRPFAAFWRDFQPLLTPLEIPKFHPRRWVSRCEGTVL